jgi:hypothetical protein
MVQAMDKNSKPVLMNFLKNEETNKLTIKEVELMVPGWGWKYLQARADTLYGGDLNTVVNEVFSAGLMAFFDLSEIDMQPVNKIPC